MILGDDAIKKPTYYPEKIFG